MSNDLKIIRQLEKQIGKKIKPVKTIDFSDWRIQYAVNAHSDLRIQCTVNAQSEVVELVLDGCNIKDISLLSELKALKGLNLKDNQLTDCSPLKALTQLTTLSFRLPDLSENTM